jgi:hypothetical protein
MANQVPSEGEATRGGGHINRAVGAQLYLFSHLFLGRCPNGVAQGWYERTPLASHGAFNGKRELIFGVERADFGAKNTSASLPWRLRFL